MPSETAELVQSWFDRWNDGDRFQGEMDEVHSDVEIFGVLQPEPFRGEDGFRRWIEEIDAQFESWRLAPGEWRDAGDGRVATYGHLHLKGQGSGLEFDEPMGWIIDVEDEKLRRMRVYREKAEWLEAAGLQE